MCNANTIAAVYNGIGLNFALFLYYFFCLVRPQVLTNLQSVQIWWHHTLCVYCRWYVWDTGCCILYNVIRSSWVSEWVCVSASMRSMWYHGWKNEHSDCICICNVSCNPYRIPLPVYIPSGFQKYNLLFFEKYFDKLNWTKFISFPIFQIILINWWRYRFYMCLLVLKLNISIELRKIPICNVIIDKVPLNAFCLPFSCHY